MSESVRSVLEEIGYALTDNGKEFRARPLYRDSDNDNVLRIWKDSGKWVDFKENKSGSLEDLIRITLNLNSITEAKEWISKRNLYQEESVSLKPKATVKQSRIFDKSILLKLRNDHSYWASRKISESVVKPFQGGLATTGKMYNRYVFPIFNSKDEIIGFAGRDVTASLDERRPKWKLIGDKKEWAFPFKLNYNELKQKKEIILVESIGDMLALRQNGISNSIVTFGLSLTSKILMSLISLNPSKIIIAFNNDSSNSSAGNMAAESVEKKLLQYFDKRQVLVRLPETNKDFGELNVSEPERILEWKSTI